MAGLDAALAGVTAWIGRNLLVDTVRITAPAPGGPVYNPDTGQNEYPEGVVLYEGPGAVLGDTAQEISAVPDVLQMWTTETRSRYRLLTPLSAPLAAKDAIVEMATVHNPANAALLGRSWTVLDPSRASTVEVVRITPLDQNQVTGGST